MTMTSGASAEPPVRPVPTAPLRARAAWGRLLAGVATLAAGCGGRDDRPAVWEYISPAIMQPNCATASCHGPAAAVSGLDLSEPDRGYTSLTALWVWIVDPSGTPENGCRAFDGIVACQRNHRPMVTPFDPAQSRLVNMLRARNAPRMPPDRVLPEADIALIERWILNGARRTITDPPPVRDAGTDTRTDGTAGGSADGADGRTDGNTPPADAGTDTSDGARADAGADASDGARGDASPTDGAGGDRS
jgi:hypothetical protein